MMTIGTLIETLISTRDTMRMFSFSLSELDAVADACNLLKKAYAPTDIVEDILYGKEDE